MSTQLPPKKPLWRIQSYLVELKEVIKLSRDALLELKELLVVVTIILFFVLGVWETLRPKVEPMVHSISTPRSPRLREQPRASHETQSMRESCQVCH